jgi:hypothetical protein
MLPVDHSVYALLQIYTEFHVTNFTFYQSAPPNKNGTKLVKLQNAASKIGMKANIDQLTWEKLFDMRDIVILHVNNNHYVLANPNEKRGNAIRVYDPKLGARWFTRKNLESIWQGTSLILVKDTNYRSNSFISAPFFMIDKGDVKAKNKALYIFPIKNISTKPVELKIVSTSCQCSSATIEREEIKSGEETVLIASVELDNKFRNFCENVTLISTCGVEERKDSFFLAGTVMQDDIVSTKRIFTGTTHRGGSFKNIFVVNDLGNGQLSKVEVKLHPSVTWMNSVITCAGATEINQDKFKRLKVKSNDWIVTLSAEIKNDAPIQNFKLPIIVQTNLEPPFSEVELSIEGEIVPAISVTPAAMIFSEQSQDRLKTISIKPLMPSLQLSKPTIDVSDIPLLYRIKPIHNNEFLVEIQLNIGDDQSKNTFNGNVVLDFGEEGVINVPVVYQPTVKSD